MDVDKTKIVTKPIATATINSNKHHVNLAEFKRGGLLSVAKFHFTTSSQIEWGASTSGAWTSGASSGETSRRRLSGELSTGGELDAERIVMRHHDTVIDFDGGLDMTVRGHHDAIILATAQHGGVEHGGEALSTIGVLL